MTCSFKDKIKALETAAVEVRKRLGDGKKATEALKLIAQETALLQGAKNKAMREVEPIVTLPEAVTDLRNVEGKDYTALIQELKKRVPKYAKLVTKDKNNINTMRMIGKDKNGDPIFGKLGNPFHKNTVETTSGGVLSAMFYDWVVKNEIPASYVEGLSQEKRGKKLWGLNKRRQELIPELKKIANKDLYYDGTARGKLLSHASVLALIADLHNKGSLRVESSKEQKVLEATGAKKQKTTSKNKNTKSKDSDTVNIWAGNGENVALSNFAPREFMYKGKTYNSVEHAYQVWKSGEFDNALDEKYEKSGRTDKIPGGKRVDKNNNLQLMEELMMESFMQNPEAKKLLLDTGDKELTHKGGKDKMWEREFPKILTRVRTAARIEEANKGTNAEKHTKKELVKARQATQYIGKGSKNSSTARYAKVYGDKANTGKYTKDDVVWVSSNGRRNNRVDPLGPNGIKELLDKAIAAEATIVMDTEEHINRTKNYNIGEVALAEYMLEQGYSRDNSSGAGVWTKNVEAVLPTVDTYMKLALTQENFDKALAALNNNDHIKAGKELMKLRNIVDEDALTDAEYDVYSAYKQELNNAINKSGINLNNTETITEAALRELFNIEQKKSTNDEDTGQLDRYELFPGVFANDEQKAAIDKLTDFLKSKDRTSILLKGRGGTGKTSIITKVLENNSEMYDKPSQVYFSAPTNKAIKVLINMSNKTTPGIKYTFKTVAQALSYVVSGGGLVRKTNSKGTEVKPIMTHGSYDASIAKILVVDEASMLTSQLQKELEDRAKRHGIKIIYMGDNVQLAPVNDPDAAYQSGVFSSHTGENRVELNKRMRQKEDSAILAITDEYAKVVESMVNDDGTMKDSSKFEKENLPKENSRDVKFVESIPTTHSDFVEAAKANPVGTRWIMFNNNQHPTGEAFSKKIRDKLFPDAKDALYAVGEQLYVESSLLDGDNKNIFTTGDELTVLKVDDEVTETFTLKVWNTKDRKYVYKEVNVPLAILTVRDNMTGEELGIYGYSDKTKKTLSTIPERGKIEPQLLKSSPAYVLTSHKAQGSTYDTVYADIGNIFDNGNGPTHYQSAYVATSRASEKLVMVGERTKPTANIKGNKVIMNEEVIDTPSREEC